jgi:hypothetical protein
LHQSWKKSLPALLTSSPLPPLLPHVCHLLLRSTITTTVSTMMPSRSRGRNPGQQFLLIWCVQLIIGYYPLSWAQAEDCGRRTYDPAALPGLYAAGETVPTIPVAVGTAENMDSSDRIPFDFTGVWWMRYNTIPEYLISFVGLNCTPSVVNFDKGPLVCTWKHTEKHAWSWDDSVAGSLLMDYMAPKDGSTTVDFYNSTYGELQTSLTDFPLILVDKWPMIKINDDEWLRQLYFKQGSILQDNSYTLTRIVYQNGTSSQFFADFVAMMERRHLKLVVFDSDSHCKRRCMGTFLGTCWSCNILCSLMGDSP